MVALAKGFGSHDQLADPDELSLVSGLPTTEEFPELPEPGQYVEAGAVLAVIEDAASIQRSDDLVQSVHRWLVRRNEVFQHHEVQDISAENDVVAELVVLEQHILELVRLNTERVIRASKSGFVVAAKRIPQPPLNEIDPTKLERWYGTPLDRRNQGCFVEVGQELMTIAPDSSEEPMQLQAVLYVDQGDRDDLQDEMEVEMKLDHLADVTYKAPVTLVSQRGDLVAPEALTTRFDGPLATKPDQQGQETLASTAYRATVVMDFADGVEKADTELMKPGMRGMARFKVGNRTAWQWAWRYLNETFRFRVG